MEESKALHKLAEAADLIGMLEEMLNPQQMERKTSASWSGMRITLRNIKHIIEKSHTALGGEMLARSREVVATVAPQNTQAAPQSAIAQSANAEIRSSSPISRKELRASLEKFMER